MNFDQGRLRVPRLAAPLVLVAAAALLAGGCGEKEEPATDGPVVPITTTTQGGQDGEGQRPDRDGGGKGKKPVSDRAAVEDAIKRFLTSPKADQVCRDLLTPAFLRRAYGNVAGCKAARRPAALAVSAQISGVNLRGATAVAKTKPNGGVNNGERLTVGLQRSGGEWKIASVRSNARVGP